MDFAQRELSEFVGYGKSSVANNATSNTANNVASNVASAEKLRAFKDSLCAMLESASKDSSEEFQKNLIAQFLRKSFGYECNVRGKADLAIYDEGKAKVLFEVKSTANKAEFVKSTHPRDFILDCHESRCDSRNDKKISDSRGSILDEKSGLCSHERGNKTKSSIDEASGKLPDLSLKDNAQKAEFSLDSKAFCESILYYLREVKREKNNNLKHIILCTAQEFYIIKAQTYHALFVANANKAIQKRIDSAYKNCDFKQGNDTSTARFYTEIEAILREMDNTLEFTYANIPALLGEGLGERLGDNERERERVKAGVKIPS